MGQVNAVGPISIGGSFLLVEQSSKRPRKFDVIKIIIVTIMTAYLNLARTYHWSKMDYDKN